MNERIKNIIPQLTGVRFLAAAMVYFSHHVLPFSGHIHHRFYDVIKEFGSTGVTVFFVLSGFLIYYRYSNRLSFSFRSLWNYFLNRYARIYPMFFLVTVISLGFQHISDVKSWILCLTFTNGFFDEYIRFLAITQGWTLTIEETFYVLAPFIFYFVLKKTSIFRIGMFIIFIGMLWFLLNHLFDIHMFKSLYFILYSTFFGRCFDFLTGIFLAKIFLQKDHTSSIGIHLTYFSVFLIGIALFILSSLASSIYLYGVYNPAGLLLNNFFLPVIIAVFFYGIIHEKTWISQILQSKLFVILGKSSYILYLIHYGVVGTLLSSFFISLWGTSSFMINHIWLNVGLTFILFTLVSIVGFYLIEDPINKWIRRKFSLKLINSNNQIQK